MLLKTITCLSAVRLKTIDSIRDACFFPRLKTRELLVYVTLAALGGAEKPLASHAQGAQKSGNSKETLVAAIVQALPYMGFPRALSALEPLK